MWALRQFLSLSTGTSFVLNSRNQIIKTLVSSLSISYAVVYKPIIKRMSVEWTPRPVWLNAPQRIMAWPTCEATNQLSTRLFYRESSLFLSNRGGRRRGVAMVSTTFFYCRLWTREARAGSDSCKQAESEEREPVRAGESSRKCSFTWAVFIIKYEFSQLLTTGSLNVGVSVLLCLCQRAAVGRWTRLYGLYWTPDTTQSKRRHSCNNTKLLLTHWTAGFSPWLWLPEQMVRTEARAHHGLVLLSLCLCVQSVPISVDLPREELEPPQSSVSHTRPPSDTNRVSNQGTVSVC